MILETILLTSLYFECGERVHPEILHAIAKTESGLNPYVIANVTDNESYRFENETDAVSKVKFLAENGKKYSVGLMQIYSENFSAYGMNNTNAFDYCKNIETGAKIYKACYEKSYKDYPDERHDYHLDNAMSCYYSGNFKRGFKKDEGLETSYVERIRNNFASIYEVPSFYNYSKFDYKGNRQSNYKKEDVGNGNYNETTEIFINNNWDVFNDYENIKN